MTLTVLSCYVFLMSIGSFALGYWARGRIEARKTAQPA